MGSSSGRPRANDDVNGTPENDPTQGARHPSWSGAPEANKNGPSGIAEWIYTHDCVFDVLGYIKGLTRTRGDPDLAYQIHTDTIVGVCAWVCRGMSEDPNKLMSGPFQALVWDKANKVFIDWLRNESTRRKRYQLCTDLTPEDTAQFNGEARPRRRASVKRHNGKEIVTPNDSATTGQALDSDWEPLESDLKHMHTALRLTKNEITVVKARTELQREYEDKGDKFPKRNFRKLIADQIAKDTGQAVDVPFVKECLKSATEKCRKYLDRRARQLLGKPGGHHEQGKEAGGERAGAPAGAQSPDQLSPPKGGGGR